MSGLDVEALLDSTASGHNGDARDKTRSPPHSSHDRHESDRDSTRDRHRSRRERSSDRGSRLGGEGDRTTHSPSFESSSRRRSRSRDSHRSRRVRDSDRATGRLHSSRDHHRDDRRYRSRSRSPRRDYDRHYRPPPREEARESQRDRGSERRDERRASRSPRSHRSRSPPQKEGLTEEERDRRTVFVQQLAARLRTKELAEFFETAGKVREAQIVKDRVSKRSKGVGYVEFVHEESVQKAIALTGQKLKGIPIIAQLTEAEKNRQARNPGESTTNSNSVPFHRLYVGNIHFSITEDDLQNVFEPFGELEFVQLQKEETGRSRGYGFVQFRDPDQAKEALEKMNGFELAGRPIRVGLGNDKFTPESTANLLQRFQGQGGHGNGQYQGSSFSGSGGRGAQAGGSGAGANFDRAGGRDNDRGAGGASALDDTDVSGVNFSNYSRDALMRKLARADEPSTTGPGTKVVAEAKPAPRAPPVQTSQPSRCIVLRNMFNPAEEEDVNWAKELEDDIRAECEDKYGHVVHISLDADSQGDVYLKFDRAKGGENAIRGLNGRYFGGRMITAQAMVDAVYNSQFPRSKDL